MKLHAFSMLSVLAAAAISASKGSYGLDEEQYEEQKTSLPPVEKHIQSLSSAKACLTAAEAKRLRRIERNKKIQEKQNG